MATEVAGHDGKADFCQSTRLPCGHTRIIDVQVSHLRCGFCQNRLFFDSVYMKETAWLQNIGTVCGPCSRNGCIFPADVKGCYACTYFSCRSGGNDEVVASVIGSQDCVQPKRQKLE